MSSYKNTLVFTLLLASFTACSNDTINLETKDIKSYKSIETKEYPYEISYVMFALEYENQGRYPYAKSIYKKLFENTNNYEYLERFVSLSFHQKDYKSILEIITPNVLEQMKGIKQEETILRVYSFSLMKMDKKDESIYFAKKVLKLDPSDVNHELLGSIYLDSKNYQEAFNEFEKSFKINNSDSTLLTLTNIQYFYLKQNEKAKNTIEKYMEENGEHYALSLQLLTFYEKDKEEEKVLNLLTKLYNKYKNEKKRLLIKKLEIY